MSRRLVLALLAHGCLFALLVIPFRQVSPHAPARPLGPEKLDIAKYGLGEILEGDGPSPERFAPGAFPAAPEALNQESIPSPKGLTVDFGHYPSSAEINAYLGELAARYPDLAQVLDLGTSWQGKPLKALRITNKRAPQPIEARPVMYIDGQHHARELISSAVVQYTAWRLLDGYGRDPLITHLVDTRVLIVVPTVNPDGNDIVLKDNQETRKTANPQACDDDNDGKFDEDPSVGYGYGSDEWTSWEFKTEWADQHPENPFVEDWLAHLKVPNNQNRSSHYLGRFSGRFGGERLLVPRKDLDGDGQDDEDEIGGTDPNRNYDTHWEQGATNCRGETFRGPELFSEPETRAIRDLFAETPHLALGIAYHSGTDLILHPWGFTETEALPDANAFELLGRKGSELTEVNGFAGSPHTWTARGLYVATGSTMDYLYEKHGVYSFSPEVYGSDTTTFIERLAGTGTFTVGQSIGKLFNPDPDQQLASTDRWNRFATYLFSSMPNVELNNLGVVGDSLVLAVGNDGWLPAEVTVTLDGAEGTALGSNTPSVLQATSQCFEFPLAAVKREHNMVRVKVVSPVGTKPHEIETDQWTFSLDAGNTVWLEAGALRPWLDLGQSFGSWFAADRYDEPGRYHQPFEKPLAASPPAVGGACSRLADVPPPSRAPTPTAPPAVPTPEPTSTSGPPPSPTRRLTATPSIENGRRVLLPRVDYWADR